MFESTKEANYGVGVGGCKRAVLFFFIAAREIKTARIGFFEEGARICMARITDGDR